VFGKRRRLLYRGICGKYKKLDCCVFLGILTEKLYAFSTSLLVFQLNKILYQADNLYMCVYEGRFGDIVTYLRPILQTHEKKSQK
jgi:hypothetical protein